MPGLGNGVRRGRLAFAQQAGAGRGIRGQTDMRRGRSTGDGVKECPTVKGGEGAYVKETSGAQGTTNHVMLL